MCCRTRAWTRCSVFNATPALIPEEETGNVQAGELSSILSSLMEAQQEKAYLVTTDHICNMIRFSRA